MLFDTVEELTPEQMRQAMLNDGYTDALEYLHAENMKEDIDYCIKCLNNETGIQDSLTQVKEICKKHDLDFKEILTCLQDSI